MTLSATSAPSTPEASLQRTPLYELHVALGARMVPFAGYAMPVQYPPGILKEHLHTREKAGLFDVSHMGQAFLVGPDHATTAAALEALVPADILDLKPGQQRYTQLLSDDGGIIDDLMVTRSAAAEDDGSLMLVVNAARKEVDYAHIAERLPDDVRLQPAPERALLALQGPAAAPVLAQLSDIAASLRFMTAASAKVGGIDCHVSRSGYTGEDGFEISLAAGGARKLARLLLEQEGVAPIGLGARDSLRLEAGLCLYGHDIDETTSPIEAGLAWSIQKRRRAEGGFPGFERIRRELARGPRAPPRRHQARGPRAGPRGHRDPLHAGRAHRHRHLGRLRPERQRPRGHGLRRRRLCRGRHAREPDGAGQGARRRHRAAAVRGAPLRGCQTLWV